MGADVTSGSMIDGNVDGTAETLSDIDSDTDKELDAVPVKVPVSEMDTDDESVTAAALQMKFDGKSQTLRSSLKSNPVGQS